MFLFFICFLLYVGLAMLLPVLSRWREQLGARWGHAAVRAESEKPR